MTMPIDFTTLWRRLAEDERRERAERAIAESAARVVQEWGDTKPPTIGGIPISRGLARKLGLELKN